MHHGWQTVKGFAYHKPRTFYPNTEARLYAEFRTEADALVDPDTVAIKILSPGGVETSYTYAAAEIEKTSTGLYTYDLVPTSGGVWFYRWLTTGADKVIALDGEIVITASPFVDTLTPRAYTITP